MRLLPRIGGLVSLLIPLTVLANAGWSELGGSASGGGISNTPDSSSKVAIALDGLGYPVVAWADMSSGVTQVYLKRWNGSAWVELGGSASGGGVSNTPEGYAGGLAMAVDGEGNPIVAWDADAQTSSCNCRHIYVRRWNGSAWADLGTASGGYTAVAQFPALAVDSSGTPLVAWTQLVIGYYGTLNYEIFVTRWDGSSWQGLGRSASWSMSPASGGISRNTGLSRTPSIAVDGQDRPVVAWADDSNGLSNIYVRRWDGTSWVELNGSATGGGISRALAHAASPVIAVDSQDRPVVAWSDTAVYLRRWNGSTWEGLGGSESTSGIALGGSPSLVLDPAGNPVVAWVKEREVHLLRWDGGAWVGQGGAEDGSSVSGTLGNSLEPALAIDASGNPFVSWSEIATDPLAKSEIYLKHWVP